MDTWRTTFGNLVFKAAILAVALLAAISVRAQNVTVTGNLKDLGLANATSPNTYVQFTLQGYGTSIPRVIGSNVFVSPTPPPLKPDKQGNINGTITGNDAIDPAGTYYQVCIFFQGQSQWCNTYNILVGQSPWNLNSAVPIVVPPPPTTFTQYARTFGCLNASATTTWTCNHQFGSSIIVVQCFDINHNWIVPDSLNTGDPNNAIITFINPQAGNCTIMNAGQLNLTNQPANAVVMNPNSDQNIIGFNLLHNGNAIPDAGSSVTWTQAQRFTGGITANIFNHVVHWDGAVYPYTQTGLANALAAACNGSIPGLLVLDPTQMQIMTIMTSSITVPSNCTVIGPGKSALILQATATSVSTPILIANNAVHVRLLDFGVDGNRANNSNVFQGIQGTGNSDVTIDGMRIANFLGNAVEFDGASLYITVSNNDFSRNGVFNGSAAAFDLFPNTSNVSQIRFGPNNIVHDSNVGVFISNPSAGQSVYDVSIFENDFYSNAEDAINVTANVGGGQILGVKVTGNRMRCMGWPANGTGFPAVCTPGLLQTGAVASGAGVGIDLIENGDQLLIQPLIQSNFIHDSSFEAVATNSNINPVVNTNGTAVTWVSGPPFNTGWKAGQVFQINAVDYKIASVSSGTSMTLQSSAGVQNGVPSFGHTFMWASVVGNTFYNNGSSIGGALAGPGIFCQFVDGNTYQGNMVRTAFLEGIQLNACDFTSMSGNKFYSNARGSVAFHLAGIGIQASMGVSLNGDATDDPRTSPTQTIGLAVDNLPSNTGSSNIICNSASIYGSTPVSDPNATISTTIGCGDTAGNVAIKSLTPGNCMQPGGGGLLQTTSSPCLLQAIQVFGSAAISGASITGGVAASLGSVALTMPAAGGPFRVECRYNINTNNTSNLANGWITDGTNLFAGSQIGSPSAFGFSPVTYANGAAVTFTLRTEGASNYTVNAAPNAGGPNSNMQCVAMPSN